MTETQATTAAAGPVFPPGRYGRRRAPRRGARPLAAVGLVAALAVGLAVAWRLYQQYGDPLYDSTVTRITESADTHVMVEFAVTVPPGAGAVCTVRARSAAGEEIGRARVPVPGEPGRSRVVTAYRLATNGSARAVDVVGCRPAEPR